MWVDSKISKNSYKVGKKNLTASQLSLFAWGFIWGLSYLDACYSLVAWRFPAPLDNQRAHPLCEAKPPEGLKQQIPPLA